MKIYFATWLFDKTLDWNLTKKRGNTRLISYYFLREQGIDSQQLKTYCKLGRIYRNKTKK
jgi:hypothetical protein